MQLIACLAGARFPRLGISAESSQALAAGATLLAYGDYTVRNGKLEVQLTIEDARSLKATKLISASVPAGDVLGAGTALARQISTPTVPYGTRNPAALESFMKALETSDATVREVGLGVAIAADPNFVPPYRLLAEAKAQRQDPRRCRRGARPGPGARHCALRTGAYPPGVAIRRI